MLVFRKILGAFAYRIIKLHTNSNSPFSGQCSHFIPPQNTTKPIMASMMTRVFFLIFTKKSQLHFQFTQGFYKVYHVLHNL